MSIKTLVTTFIDDGPEKGIVVTAKGKRYVVTGLPAIRLRAQLREIEAALAHAREPA